MKTEGQERRLTTILAADVVGFSRLMEADENGTFSALKAHREELIEPKTRQYGGRTVKLMGDGVLMEFASVVDAVLFAVEVQCAMREHNEDVPAERRIVYRIGINIGDIIVEGDDIYGDGVNIAARLEGLAEPGGICVSHNVFSQVKNKVEVGFEDLGDQQVKNIEEPVRIYKVTAGPCERLKGELAIVAGATATEDLITELARFQNLVVIARNSTFTFKGKAPRVKDVARDLGVHYVVEGSVRKAGNRVRVTVQLIESKSEKHVWAERYDRDLTDIFEIQDEVTQAIIGALPSRLEAADIERIKRKPPQDLAAYDYVLRSKILHHHGTREANAEALEVLDKAIELDPDYAQAYAWKACTLRQAILRGYAEEPDAFNAQRIANAEKALALDKNDMVQRTTHRQRGKGLGARQERHGVSQDPLRDPYGTARPGQGRALSQPRLRPEPQRSSHAGPARRALDLARQPGRSGPMGAPGDAARSARGQRFCPSLGARPSRRPPLRGCYRGV
jgi:adenylate cyclase